MQDMLASQATQLRELQHVIGFIDKFISNYKRMRTPPHPFLVPYPMLFRWEITATPMSPFV